MRGEHSWHCHSFYQPEMHPFLPLGRLHANRVSWDPGFISRHRVWGAALSCSWCIEISVIAVGGAGMQSTNYSNNSCHDWIFDKCWISTVYASSHLTLVKTFEVEIVTLIL